MAADLSERLSALETTMGSIETVVAGPDGLETFAVSPLAFADLLQAHPEVVRPIMRGLVGRIRRLEGNPVTDD